MQRHRLHALILLFSRLLTLRSTVDVEHELHVNNEALFLVLLVDIFDQYIHSLHLLSDFNSRRMLLLVLYVDMLVVRGWLGLVEWPCLKGRAFLVAAVIYILLLGVLSLYASTS